MTALDDLRFINDELDHLLQGGICGTSYVTTKTGEALLKNVRELHGKYIKLLFDKFKLENQVKLLHKELDGVRDSNEILTNELEAKSLK